MKVPFEPYTVLTPLVPADQVLAAVLVIVLVIATIELVRARVKRALQAPPE